MALPPEIQIGLYFDGIAKARTGPNKTTKNDHIGITGTNVKLYESRLNCALVAAGNGNRTPKFDITDGNPRNFVFVDNIPQGVAIGIVPASQAATHVLSDQYGGCKWHILSDGQGNAAFLHVYAGGGTTTPYNMAGGWALKQIIPSGPVARMYQDKTLGIPTGNVVSYGYRAGGSQTVEVGMLVLDGMGRIKGIHLTKQVQL